MKAYPRIYAVLIILAVVCATGALLVISLYPAYGYQEGNLSVDIVPPLWASILSTVLIFGATAFFAALIIAAAIKDASKRLNKQKQQHQD